MTTVAWDGKTLAADRQATTGGTATPTTKVFKVENGSRTYLVGFSGSLQDGQAFVKYVKNGFKKMPKVNSLSALIVHKSGKIITHNDTNDNPCDLGKLGQWALGSGCDFALGAMAFGATAAEAVLIATDLDVNTGLGVDTVSF